MPPSTRCAPLPLEERSNYLFMGSLGGGQAASIAYTLIETAKMNSLDAQAWLTEVLHRIRDHPHRRVGALELQAR